MYVSPREVFMTFAEQLKDLTDPKFRRALVEMLNSILLTCDELYELRDDLRLMKNQV